MRIVQVLPRYAPAWAFGGGVRMFWTLAQWLGTRGHQVLAVSSDAMSAAERCVALVEELSPNVTVRRFRNPNMWLSTYASAFFLRPRGMRSGIRRAVREADVVHMGESRGLYNFWTAEACASEGVPLVWSAYGGLAEGTGIRGLYRDVHDLLFTRRVVARVDRFVAQSRHERNTYLRHGASAEGIAEIPLCVDWREFETLPDRGSFRRRHNIPSDARLIVSMARFSPVKSLDLLIGAFARLGCSHNQSHLALVGWDHGDLLRLRHLARSLGLGERVHFCGPVFGAERLTAYVDADVFALTPQVFEEMSLAGLEAAACGVPTLLSPQCEIPGLQASAAGAVVEPQLPDITDALNSLLADAAGRTEMGHAARQFVRERFTSERIALEHEQLFQSVAK